MRGVAGYPGALTGLQGIAQSAGVLLRLEQDFHFPLALIDH
jgi:hypothetical protein